MHAGAQLVPVCVRASTHLAYAWIWDARAKSVWEMGGK